MDAYVDADMEMDMEMEAYMVSMIVKFFHSIFSQSIFSAGEGKERHSFSPGIAISRVGP